MTLQLTNDWDKVFPKSDKVNHQKVSFKNHFGIEIAADLYEPKEHDSKLPAIAIAGPYDNFDKIPFDKIENFLKDSLEI